MQKIACIFSFKMSSWVSCQKIVFNLQRSYQLYLHKAHEVNKEVHLLNFNYSLDQKQAEILKTSKEIINAEPDIIVIMDHRPHPFIILQLVLPFLQKKPRIIFHLFGDFTLNYSQWDKVGKLLAGYKVDFVVASERQKDLIDKYLPEEIKAEVCPFPVNKSEFSYNPSLRKLQRMEWGVKDDDMVYVFTGRISLQKRTHTLLKSFTEFLEKTGTSNAHLFIYGQPDFVGDQFLGKWEKEGEYFRRINRLYKDLPKHAQEKIHFMGGVPNAELKAVYQGADMLVNLSVHNDEDYGMSVAEAQCSGLPAILTDWGGLAGFEHPELPDATIFIPVKIGKRFKLIHFESIVKSFEATYKRGHVKDTDRSHLSELALSKFGVEAAGMIVKRILERDPGPFTAFSPFFDKVLSRILFSPTPYIDPDKKISKLYREIYSSYVRPN